MTAARSCYRHLAELNCLTKKSTVAATAVTGPFTSLLQVSPRLHVTDAMGNVLGVLLQSLRSAKFTVVLEALHEGEAAGAGGSSGGGAAAGRRPSAVLKSWDVVGSNCSLEDDAATICLPALTSGLAHSGPCRLKVTATGLADPHPMGSSSPAQPPAAKRPARGVPPLVLRPPATLTIEKGNLVGGVTWLPPAVGGCASGSAISGNAPITTIRAGEELGPEALRYGGIRLRRQYADTL